ncbi:hypothetical protein Tco_0178374 [Tanacetum coccineum]
MWVLGEVIQKLSKRVYDESFSRHADDLGKLIQIMHYFNGSRTISTEEPTRKSKRVKRPAKKSTKAPARGVVIRETPEMSLSKKKEKVDITRGKEIELLSEVALAKDSQFEEVRRKSIRDFHKTHSSGSDTITKTVLSAEIKPSVTNKGPSVKPGVPDVMEDESSEKAIEDDEDEVKDEFVKTSSNDSDDEDETKITNKVEGDEDEEMDYTTSQLYDDVDIRLNEPVDTNKGFVQEEGTDAAMTKKTEVLITSSSHSSDLAAKFLNFSDIPHTDAEIGSPMDVHVYIEVPSKQTPTLLTVHVLVITDSSPVYSTVIPQSLPSFTSPPQQSISTPPPTTEATNPPSTLPDFTLVFQFNNRVTALEKEVVELKKDPLHTQVTALVYDHLDARMGATTNEFINFLLASLTIVKESLEDAVLAKESSQPQSSYEVAATLTEFKLKKIMIDKMDKSESYLAALEHREFKDAEPTKGPKAKESQSGSSKGTKTQPKSFGKSVQLEEPEFEVVDSDMPQDQEENPGNDDEEPKEKTQQQGQNQSWLMTLASSAEKPSKTFDELMSTPIDFSAFIMNGLKINNLTQETLLGPSFRLLKGIRSNYAELEYDF